MSNECCVQHLVRTNRGVLVRGTFITNHNHCIDGERARCSTCKRTWVHICDEAEGCAWECVTKQKAAGERPDTPDQAAPVVSPEKESR